MMPEVSSKGAKSAVRSQRNSLVGGGAAATSKTELQGLDA